ncbi:MAG: putative rane protein [Rhodocyclaceae bacterium]|nr:putative rane protein [Rhodocyclaceae bacterium]
MKILTWALRLIIFLFLFAFAAQNTEPVSLRFVLGQIWQAPLVIILLAFFAGGALLGVLSLLGVVFRQRREIARLKRDLDQPVAPVAVEPPPLA